MWWMFLTNMLGATDYISTQPLIEMAKYKDLCTWYNTQVNTVHVFAGEFAMCSSHIVMQADGEAPTY